MHKLNPVKRKLLYALVVLVLVFIAVDKSFWMRLNFIEHEQYVTSAIDYCMEHEKKLPSKSFKSDGCSMWPNGNWTHCCIEHDFAYWCGGDISQRKMIDKKLGECINDVIPGLGTIVYLGVRVGGVSILPTSFRWGYGHVWPKYQ